MRVVIDTNVVFEGLTTRGGACRLVIEAWLAGLFRPHISTALAYEYADVLGRKLSATRWQALEPVLRELLARTEFVQVYFSWRPVSPDPADDLVVDCAMNASAVVITSNVRDFRSAQQSLGLRALTPVEFASVLTEFVGEG